MIVSMDGERNNELHMNDEIPGVTQIQSSDLIEDGKETEKMSNPYSK